LRDITTSFPVLGKIPILGWLFKNKNKEKVKEDLLILISAHVVGEDTDAGVYTKRHLKEYKGDLNKLDRYKNHRDPVERAFFKDRESDCSIDEFIFKRGKLVEEGTWASVCPDATEGGASSFAKASEDRSGEKRKRKKRRSRKNKKKKCKKRKVKSNEKAENNSIIA